MIHPPSLFDAHLDLAYNAVCGRDVTRPAREQSADEQGIPSVGLPDLRDGNVRRICATIYCEPNLGSGRGYTNADEAFAMADAQLDWYHARFATGDMTLVTDGLFPEPIGIGAILLLEGADPIRTPADVEYFFGRGVRAVGLAWKRTRYAGGTGAPGPLTPAGVELVHELDRFGIVHDASHLAEESFWQLLDLSAGPVMASHSNCRAIVPTDRQLSDDMARAIARRGGVIGINFFDRFLLSPGDHGKRRANLADVVRHVRHFCDLIGDTSHVGLGTDMDGGFGRDNIPQEIETSADLPRVATALSETGFSDACVRRIMGGNWAEYFEKHLP